MGRAMIIITMGLLVALGYTFFGMKTTGQTMNQRNLNTYNAIKAKNIAHTGIQIAIEEYNNRKSDNDSSNDEFSNFTVTNEGATLSLTVDEDNANQRLRVTSLSTYQGTEHEVISTFDISQSQPLVPEFVGALSVASGNFSLNTGNGKVHFDGHDRTGACSDKPGVTVPTDAGVNQVGYDTGIGGNPANVAVKDESINFDEVSDLIKELDKVPGAKHISGNYKGDLGTATDPGVFFVDSYTKLTGGIDAGHGILIIRSGGELDLEGELSVAGNFEFNGLVVFENAYNFKGRGTPDINGTVIAGSSDGGTTLNIDANGEINVQYDCKAKEYADEAVNNLLNTTIYQRLSIYE